MCIENVSRSDSHRLYLGFPFYFIASAIRRTNATLGQVVSAVQNWWDVPLIFSGLRKSAKLRFRNGAELEAQKRDLGRVISLAEFNNLSEDAKRKLRIKVLGDQAIMHVRGRRLLLDLEVANPVAMEVATKEHSMIDVRGRDVVDIGAYVDDTAIYYVLYCGAKHVYAFEPFPYLYKTGVRNVKTNKLDKLITTYNLAVAGGSGTISLDKNFTSFGMVGAKNKKRKSSGSVGVVSLDSVVKELGINHGALKVDCEGCEYGIFRYASSRALSSFDLIHIEYHYGYSDIVERLGREGFDVDYTKPVYNFQGFGKRAMLNGHIIATRRSARSAK